MRMGQAGLHPLPPRIPACAERFRMNNGTITFPDLVSFYVFNITNVDGMRNGDKPRVVGPARCPAPRCSPPV